MSFYVYVLSEPGGRPRYVGCTNDWLRRKGEHVTSASACPSTREWINELARRGGSIQITVVAELESLEDAYALEELLIAHLRSYEDLLNRTDGGWRGLGARWHHTEESKRAIGENCQWKGKRRDPAECARMSEGQARSWTPGRHAQYDETIRQRRLERTKRGERQ